MENEKTKTNFKYLLIFMTVTIVFLLLTGIVSTFILKSKQNELKSTNLQNSQLEQEYNELKDIQDYKNSDKYKDDYYEYENNYGNEGDKIIEIQ